MILMTFGRDIQNTTRKLKHANSILEYFEYFSQMSSKNRSL